MKKVLFGLVLLGGLALIGTSCNKDNDTVTPEVETGVMAIDNQTMTIAASNAVNYGQQNAIVLAPMIKGSSPMLNA